MIHETEIRIGNWVANIHTGNPYQLTINKMIGLLPHFRENILYVKPIQITEDVLLKCGFTKHEATHANYFNVWIDEKETTYLSIYSNENYWIGCEDTNEIVGLGKIKHLHQLQNLYFTLTGKELQIEALL